VPTTAADASRTADDPKPSPVGPRRLTTRDLGEDNVTRGEGAIEILADVLKNPDLVDGGQLPAELPNKQLIFRALAMMDSRIKDAQKCADSASETVGVAESELARAEEHANRTRAQESLRNKGELKRLEEKRQAEAELARGLALERKLRERQVEFDSEESEKHGAVRIDLESLKREKEGVLKREALQRVTEQTESVDVVLSTKRGELDRLLAESAETEAERAAVEMQFNAKLSGASHATSDRSAAPPFTTQYVVATILTANQKLASESHMVAFTAGIASGDTIADESSEPSLTEELENARDPKEGKTSAEWAQLSQQVTGFADALYSEPSEAPYYEHNEKTHALIAPLVKEYIRDQKSRLDKHWSDLAEEYEYRRKAYNRLMKKRNKGRKQKKSNSVAVRHSILGNKPGAVILESSGGRTSTNPYRRARRGNEVRSEYEQEQIIAEIAAKEAMEKKIHFGGSKIPRQVGRLERELTARFVNTFTAQRVDDVEAQDLEESLINPWTDMEKCIFLDRFMQHPKDFRKIASFLRNKSTKDCVAFYYNSKKTIPYKSALKEHNMRRKRRGDYHVWDATIEAAIACGAVIEAGSSEEKPLLFFLPSHDRTFNTHTLHPIKREMLDAMEIDENAVLAYEEQVEREETPKKSGSRRRREPLFVLEPEKRRFLRSSSPETVEMKTSLSRTSLADTEATDTSLNEKGDASEAAGGPTSRRAPQKWTNTEKRVFVETLEKHGRNWSLLAEAVGTKTISQIKNFYYDFKKQSGKLRPDAKKPPRAEVSARARRREDDASTPTPVIRDSLAETPKEIAKEELTPRTPWVVQESQPHQRPQPQIPNAAEILSREPQEELLLHQQHSRSSTPDGLSMAERWLQLQHQSLLQQQSQSTEEAALRLLQQHHQRQQQHHHHHQHSQPHGSHHHHSHHQQLLSNLLPWMAGSSGVVDYANATGSLRDWEQLSNAQQLQHFLQLRQHHQEQQQQRHQHHLPQHLSPLRHHPHQPHLQPASNPFASIGAHSQLGAASHPLSAAASQLRAARGLPGAGGFNSAALELALAHQQAQQGGSAASGPSSDVAQLAFAQQMMAFQAANSSADGSTALTADALALLQRAMGNQHRAFGGSSGPPSDR
jgi:nuclear receptor co-repressor 1